MRVEPLSPYFNGNSKKRVHRQDPLAAFEIEAIPRDAAGRRNQPARIAGSAEGVRARRPARDSAAAAFLFQSCVPLCGCDRARLVRSRATFAGRAGIARCQASCGNHRTPRPSWKSIWEVEIQLTTFERPCAIFEGTAASGNVAHNRERPAWGARLPPAECPQRVAFRPAAIACVGWKADIGNLADILILVPPRFGKSPGFKPS